MLPLQGAQVRALVRELRSSMPLSVAKKKKKKKSESFTWVTKNMAREGLDYGLLGEVVEDTEKPSVRNPETGTHTRYKGCFSCSPNRLYEKQKMKCI